MAGYVATARRGSPALGYVATARRGTPALGYVATAQRGVPALGRHVAVTPEALGYVATARRGTPALGYTAVTPEAMTGTRRYVGGMGAEPENAGFNQAIMWGSVALLTLGVFWATTRPGGGLAPNPRRKPTRRYTRGYGSRISKRRRRTSRRGTKRRARSTRRGRKRRTSRRGTKRRARSTRRRRPTPRRRYSRRHGGYLVRRPVVNNKLTASERRKIPKSQFVFPERRAWPLDTKKRAKAAISYLQMGRVKSASDFNKIRNAIRKKYPSVWEQYGKGLTWDKAKKAKRKRARSKGRKTKKAAN